MSLLEVVLAMSIFGLSMAILGELVRIGLRSANDARDLTTAQLYCDSLMAEIASNVRAASSVPEGTPLEYDPEWLYSVRLEEAEQPGLVAAVVTVERSPQGNSGNRRASFSLRRWIQDPGLDLSPTDEEMSTGEASTPSGSTPTPTAGSPAGGASGS